MLSVVQSSTDQAKGTRHGIASVIADGDGAGEVDMCQRRRRMGKREEDSSRAWDRGGLRIKKESSHMCAHCSRTMSMPCHAARSRRIQWPASQPAVGR